MSNNNPHAFQIDRERMPAQWPTHRIPSEFWEELGRTLGTLAFLEDCLKRANLAITATRTYRTVEQAEDAFATWQQDLETSLNDTLGQLGKRLATAIRADKRYSADAVDAIEQRLKSIAEWRNALCHGAWVGYDQDSGEVTLRYWKKDEWRQRLSRTLSTTDVATIRRKAVALTYEVVDAVTLQGIQFPGSTSPGKEIQKEFKAPKSSHTGESGNAACD